MKKIHFNKKVNQLITISLIINLASLLSGLFINIFLLKITSDVMSIVKYNLIMYLTITLFFPLLSYISKKYSVTLVFRISIIFQILYYASIILSGNSVSDYIYIFGILAGIGNAANANSINQLTVQLTDTNNRSGFLSISGTLNSIAAMISPVLSGVIITLFNKLVGYYVIFAISMLLYIIAFGMSAWFREKIPAREFHFLKVIRTYNKKMLGVNITQFFIGIRDGIFGFLINIIVFDIVQKESIFGATTAFSKLIVVITYWLGSRYIRKNNIFIHFKYSAWLMFAAPIPLFFFTSQWSVVAQIVMDSIASPIVAITLNSLMYNKIESIVEKDNLEELLAVKEVWLNIGKVIGVAGFMLLYPVLNTISIYIIVLVTNTCYILSYFIYKRMKN